MNKVEAREVETDRSIGLNQSCVLLSGFASILYVTWNNHFILLNKLKEDFMGGILSSGNACSSSVNYDDVVTWNESRKRQRLSMSYNEENPRLIPCLPDEISIHILARVPRICYFNMRLVSWSWREALMSPELFSIRKELGKTEEWLYVLTKVDDDSLMWYALDPTSKIWQRLPPIPSIAYEEEYQNALSSMWMWSMVGRTIRLADVVRSWLGRKDTSKQMPLCGCAIGALGGCLYVLGGFSRATTLRSVWRFDPTMNSWTEVSPMSTGRAYCKTGILKDKLYVVGGVSRVRGGFNPLQSAEVFDPCSGTWSEVPSMPFSKAQVLPTAFLADIMKPIATGMTSYMGKLCVPQSLYSWPFFVDVGGEMYDPETNAWIEMPIGMGDGWPARQAGTKLSVVVDGELYALDPSSSLDNGKIKVYDQKEDAWKVAISRVPLYDFQDSESPYLLAGFHGKLHVITKNINHEITVLQADPNMNVMSPSSSSSALCDTSLCELISPVELDTVIWKVVTSRSFGSAELVGCLVINL